MTSRLTKQQLLDGLKSAGVEIPANMSSARLREAYENALAGNIIKDGQDSAAVLSKINAATAVVHTEDSAANPKTEASKAAIKTYAKLNTDDNNDANAKTDESGKENTITDVRTDEGHQFSFNSNTDLEENARIQSSDLDRQLEILRKKHELLQLQHAIAILENGSSQQTHVSQVSTSNRLTFRDIEHTIVKFDGENRAYSVYDFVCNFERVMHMVAADELFKYTSLCNSLAGTARLLLNKADIFTYVQLKAALIKEFGRAINRGEIYKILANHKWNKKDNIRRYVLEMENIASRCGDIDEFELIGFIIDGMQDNTPEAYLLMNARTMDQFKESLNLYEQRRANRPITVLNTTVTAKKQTEANFTPTDASKIRCYNCTQMGHYQSKCPYDKRPDGSCFRCWQMGHDHRNCPNPKKLLKIRKREEVAAVNPDEDSAIDDSYCQTINAVNNPN